MTSMVKRTLHTGAILFAWLATFAVLAGVLAVAFWIHQADKKARADAEKDARDKAAAEKRVYKSVIKMSLDDVGTYIQDEKPHEVDWVPRQAVYGRVIPNPGAASEVRAAFAGRIRHGLKPAPRLAQRVEAGQILGWLDVRVGPQERLDLQIRRNEAAAKLQGAIDIQHIREERINRLKPLAKSIPQTELDTALVELAEANTQLNIARAADKQLQAAVDSLQRQGDGKDLTWSQPLTAPAQGEITELPVRPGMAVEAGTLIARIVNPRRALVRVDIPVSVPLPPQTLELSIIPSRPTSHEEAAPVPATLLGPAAQFDASSQFAGWLYEVDTQYASLPLLGTAGLSFGDGQGSWLLTAALLFPDRFLEPGLSKVFRPGLFVKSFVIAGDAKPIKALSVPATALLYHQGRTIVYIRKTKDEKSARYEKQEVRVLARVGNQVIFQFLSTEPGADDPVVILGAQELLSLEFRQDADVD